MIKRESLPDLRANAAQTHLRDPQVGSNMAQWHTMKQVRSAGHQVEVPLLGSFKLHGNKPLFGLDQLLADQFTSPVGNMNVACKKRFQILRPHLVQIACFQGFDMLITRLAGDVAFHGNHHIPLLSEPERHIPAIGVGVRTHDAAPYEIERFFHPPRANQRMALRVLYLRNMRYQSLP